MQYKILMVDDDLKNIKATRGFLEVNGFAVTAVQTAEEALSLVKKDEYALALLDFNMPDTTGDALAKMIHEINPLQQISMYSSDPSRDALKLSYRSGALDFIEKNEEPDVILNRIQTYCRRFDEVSRTIRPLKDNRENQRLLERVGMIGQSTVMANVAVQIEKLAKAGDVSVLIHGESGTGKELVALALHELSPRAKGPFVTVNCAAIPKDLLESMLFGHKQGSFTGATANQDGKFVLAHGGTIFLDEIGDLPLHLQSKLLRVLQERVVEPLGSRSSRKIDVRVICASHKNIGEEVKKGLFREDLMYRIKVVEVELPPLRDRGNDLELLVEHFTVFFNRKHGFPRYRRFAHSTLEILKQYSWPGNVRELSSVMEKHLIQTSLTRVPPEELDSRFFEKSVEVSAMSDTTLADLDDQFNKAKLTHILQTIEESGSKVEAARRLGVRPNHLQYLLNESKLSKQVAPKR